MSLLIDNAIQQYLEAIDRHRLSVNRILVNARLSDAEKVEEVINEYVNLHTSLRLPVLIRRLNSTSTKDD